jgi:hypothetical protein
MPTFRIMATMTTYGYIEIEAIDEEDALIKAADIDGGDFDFSDDVGEWRTEVVEKIENEEKKDE